MFLQPVGEQRLQRHRDAVVEFLASGRKQTTVGRILGKGMLEYVCRLRRHTTGVEQLSIGEGSKMGRQVLLCQPRLPLGATPRSIRGR